MIVVLPAPVCPTIATRSPGRAWKLTPLSTQSGLAVARVAALGRRTRRRWNSISPRVRGRQRVRCRRVADLVSAVQQPKMRSEDAIAPCSMLYFSERSWIGRKKRRAYWRNAATTPTVTRARAGPRRRRTR